MASPTPELDLSLGESLRSPTSTVVVCVYTVRRWDDITSGLEALMRGTEVPDQVIVVVDHNHDLLSRLTTWVQDRSLERVVVIANDGPRGLSGSRNTAIARAAAGVLAFLDDDALPADDWLSTLTRPLRQSDVAAVGGRAVPVWPSGHRPGWFPDEYDWVVGSSYRGLPDSAGAVRNVIGCSMAFRTDVFADVGVFIDGIGRVGTVPKGCEETELCIRIGQREDQGPKLVWYEPDSVVYHRVSDDRTRLGYFTSRCWAEGQSKAEIGMLIGHGEGTASERVYVRSVLPSGVRRGVVNGLRGEMAGYGRAVMIVVGLAATVAGYASKRAQLTWGRRRDA